MVGLAERSGLILLAAFLLFVPFGSAPIYIGPIKLDNLIGIALVALLAVHLLLGARLQKPPLLVYGAALLYFLALYVSVKFSDLPAYSLGRYSIIAGYAFVALTVPALYAARVVLLSRLMMVFAVMAATVLWLSYFLLGMSDWGRMTIPTWYQGGLEYFPQGWGSSADPNMLGFGMLLALLFALASQPRLSWHAALLTGFVVAAVLLTFSRTAFVALILALVAGFLLVKLPSLLQRAERLSFPAFKALKLSMLVAAAGIGLWLIVPVEAFAERLISGDSARLQIYSEVLAHWARQDGHGLLGTGFNMARTRLDPHNIYLTALHDSGVLGLLGLLVFMTSVLIVALSIVDERLRFFAVTIFFYIAFAGVTYWHTKTFWVAIMFVLLLSRARPSVTAGESLRLCLTGKRTKR